MGMLRRAALAAALALGGAAGAGQSVAVDAGAGTVRVAAKVAKQGVYKELEGAIEYVLVSEGGKAYETLFVTDASPSAIHEGLEAIGLRGGQPAEGESPPRGPAVRLFLELQAGGEAVRRPVDAFIRTIKSGEPLEPVAWLYTGSSQAFDPEAGEEVLQATLTKSIVGLHYTDPSPLVQNPRPEAKTENLYTANAELLPEAGAAVTLVFERERREVPAGTRRVHVFLTGRVQGVGFRAFTQREARRLGLTGWVKNLADGRVEAVAEGPASKVEALLAKIRRGPRAARVEKLESRDEEPTGEFRQFEIRY